MAGTVIRAGESQGSVLPALPIGLGATEGGGCNAFSIGPTILGGTYHIRSDGTLECCKLTIGPFGEVLQKLCIPCNWSSNGCVDAKPVRPPLIFTAPPVGGVFQR